MYLTMRNEYSINGDYEMAHRHICEYNKQEDNSDTYTAQKHNVSNENRLTGTSHS